jgi:pyruvate ferredoxin oxidoreductase alpha subunit
MPRQILEGSRAIALTVKNIKPAVISAYPITPQTHIVEDLAKFKADGEADYEYVRAESEFAAASIVLGASATGVRVYTATSSQGLLLMNEVIYNIAGMRLPIVMTLANRGVSAPITIWNDHQDAMSIRDAGWIMLFAENAQEAVTQHILAYKLAEELKLPVIVNVDGFVLTHTYEPVTIPTTAQIKKFLPDFKPKKGEFLDPASPATFGAFAAPAFYQEIRQDLQKDLLGSKEPIIKEYNLYNMLIGKQLAINSKISARGGSASGGKNQKSKIIDHALYEYYGPKNPKTILVAMGSVAGTIKDAVDEANKKSFSFLDGVGILKLRVFRPFPAEELRTILGKAKNVGVIEKAISLGQAGPLALEIRAALAGGKTSVKSFVTGLGGRDITGETIKKIITETKSKRHANEAIFIS